MDDRIKQTLRDTALARGWHYGEMAHGDYACAHVCTAEFLGDGASFIVELFEDLYDVERTIGANRYVTTSTRSVPRVLRQFTFFLVGFRQVRDE